MSIRRIAASGLACALVLAGAVAAEARAGARPPAAEAPASGAASAAAAGCASPDLRLTQPEPGYARLGTVWVLRFSGGCRERLAQQWQAEPARLLAIYLDGVEMKGLETGPPEADEAQAQALEVRVLLRRDSNQTDSREAWARLMSRQNSGYEMKPRMAVAIGNDRPVTIQGGEARIAIARAGQVWLAVLLGLAFVVGAFVALVRDSNALRDDPGGNYSLAKSQMAFWGLLVFASVVAVWAVTQTLERVSPQALMLLGISGATGVAAIAIGSRKKQRTELRAELEAEKAALVAAQAGGHDTGTARVKAIDAQIAHLDLSATPAFWRDLFDDGTGASFHRIQAVAWTLGLGCVFVWTVATTMAMPEFADELLLLMGVSNGTYLGFKFTEKT